VANAWFGGDRAVILPDGEGIAPAGPVWDETAAWEWRAGPESPVRRPTDLLAGFGDDPRRWPEEFDLDRLGRISTEQWANDYCWRDTFDGRTEATWGQWANSWPIPVDRAAIFEAFPPSEEHHPAPFANAMPWGGREHAVFIHSFVDGADAVTAFFLADRHVEAPSGLRVPFVWFAKAGSRFVLRGPNPTGPAVPRYVEHARSWWNRYEAPRVGAGRPPGSTARNLAGYRALYRLIFGEDLRPPTREEFVARSDIPESTVKRNLKAWGYTWTSFSEECQAIMAEDKVGAGSDSEN
jgi:hypothetical protein